MRNRKKTGWLLLPVLLVMLSGTQRPGGKHIERPAHPPLANEKVINSSELSGGIIQVAEDNICIEIELMH